MLQVQQVNLISESVPQDIGNTTQKQKNVDEI